MPDGATALHIACQNGEVDAALLCLDRGAVVDRPNLRGATPLLNSCLQGHADVAKLLIDRGAEIDRAERNGATPLYVRAVR